MSGSISRHTSSALRQVAQTGGVLAALVTGLLAALASAPAEPSDIPNLASADFGWQSNVADWQEPPAGSGHGPIKPDPDHPYTSNAEGARTGKPPTKRIGNYKDPVLKPWAAAQMKA